MNRKNDEMKKKRLIKQANQLIDTIEINFINLFSVIEQKHRKKAA